MIIDVSKRKNMKIIYPDSENNEGTITIPSKSHYDTYEDSAVIRELNKTSAFKHLINSYKEVGKMIYKKLIKEHNRL